jgi:hypothetical protein
VTELDRCGPLRAENLIKDPPRRCPGGDGARPTGRPPPSSSGFRTCRISPEEAAAPSIESARAWVLDYQFATDEGVSVDASGAGNNGKAENVPLAPGGKPQGAAVRRAGLHDVPKSPSLDLSGGVDRARSSGPISHLACWRTAANRTGTACTGRGRWRCRRRWNAVSTVKSGCCHRKVGPCPGLDHHRRPPCPDLVDGLPPKGPGRRSGESTTASDRRGRQEPGGPGAAAAFTGLTDHRFSGEAP